MKFSEIKDLSVDELNKKKTELNEHLFELRMKNSLGQLGNQAEVRYVRKDIARLNTALTAAKKAVNND